VERARRRTLGTPPALLLTVVFDIETKRTCGMVKFWLILAVALTALSFLIGRSPSVPRADLVYVNTSGIHTLDPARMSWTPDFRVALNLWEGLTSWDPRTNEVIEAAAEFPPEVSSDGLTYRFTIREDARWSNGDRVTSHDFVRGWRRAIEPGSAADYAFLITKHILGAEQYVQWRREGVSVLTALDRLCQGATITTDRIRTLQASPSFTPFLHSILHDAGQPGMSLDAIVGTRHMDRDAIDRKTWCEVAFDFREHHAAELHARFQDVGLQTPDERTLVVRITLPCPYFTDITGMPVFLPCHESIELLRIREHALPITRLGLVIYDPQWTKPDYHAFSYPGLITNGAYRLTSWTFKRNLRMDLNPYYRAAAHIDCRTVEMRVYENRNAALTAYATGDVDFLPDLFLPYDHEIARLARSGERLDFHLCDAMATYFLLFNCADAEFEGRRNPFVDPGIRKAFSLALDRATLVEKVLARGDRVALSFIPPGITPGYHPPTTPLRDVAAARRLLRDWSAANNSRLPTVDLLCLQRDQRLIQAIARQWEETLDVTINLRVLESKTFAEAKASRGFMIATGNWYADFLDPVNFLDCFASHSGNNDAGYSNSRYDDMLDAAAMTTNTRRRLAKLAAAESLLLNEDVPLIPILHYAEPIAIRPEIDGLYPNARLWFPFRLVSR